MSSARLSLRATVDVKDAMLAIRLVEESCATRSLTPILLLGQDMFHNATRATRAGGEGFDQYLSKLESEFATNPALVNEE
jgi:hypothetical protein